jgi:hypothetical protein
MASKRTARPTTKAASESVDVYLDALEHPHKKGVQLLRKAILSLDANIHEEVKWNAPSFRLEDHFATFRLHPGTMFQLILHPGAKVKASPKQFLLDDPRGLVKWATKDRCTIAFESDADATMKSAAVKQLVKDWISQL